MYREDGCLPVTNTVNRLDIFGNNCFWRGCFLHREEITMKRIYSLSLPRNISLRNALELNVVFNWLYYVKGRRETLEVLFQEWNPKHFYFLAHFHFIPRSNLTQIWEVIFDRKYEEWNNFCRYLFDPFFHRKRFVNFSQENQVICSNDDFLGCESRDLYRRPSMPWVWICSGCPPP